MLKKRDAYSLNPLGNRKELFMKRVFSAFLVIVMLLSAVMLPACNKTPNPTETQSTTGSNVTTDPKLETTDPTGDDTTEPTGDNTTDPIDPTEEPTDPTEAPTDPTEAPTDPTEAPTDAPKPTDPPATQPPATQPPATEPPVTEPPATEPPATEPPTEPEHIKILGPTGEVFPYADIAKKYLQEGGDVGKYTFPACKNAAKPIEITWKADFTPKKFYIRYTTDETFATYIEVTASGSKSSVSVYNLFKGATYYVQVSATDDAGVEHVATSTFQTTTLGPRVLYVEGTHNVRDVGGYQTSFGKTTLQGLIIRGDELYPDVTYQGIKTLSDVLGIKTEIDVRIPSQSEWKESTSIIPGATLLYTPLSGYSDAFSSSLDGYRAAFQAMAKPENYPIYIHCTGGADRTGTVCYLLNALLGVSEEELIQDYEFTTFSDWGLRSTKSGSYYGYYKTFYQNLTTKFEGETLMEHVENYLLWIGVKQAEIDTIRGIMFGEIPVG